MVRESHNNGLSGLPIALTLLTVSALALYGVITGVRDGNPTLIIASSIGLLLALALLGGLFMVNPNEGRVLQLFGDYAGTARTAGLRWANPFYTKKRVSLRVRNFESSRLKVNDIDGNPIEIAAVVVWQVVDTAEAIFEVDDYDNYREGADRVGAAQPRDRLSVRRRRRRADFAARAHGDGRRAR